MLHSQTSDVRSLLLSGSFGLERENLRITENGRLSHTPDPFACNAHIVRDFCENQVEINTPVVHTPTEAVEALRQYDCLIQQTLHSLPQPELLWPFSNPPFIANEADIPVARYYGAESSKTEYRNYLSDRYGRYKMTFSGIHFNYAFSDELLKADFARSGEGDFRTYKDRLYLSLAEQCAAYSWLMVAITAASPLLDGSYVKKGVSGETIFNGMASSRCSELGYWNAFTPILDYSSLDAYVDSIQNYVSDGLLHYPSELYYPVRLKPAGSYRLETLRENGVDHIEFRMIDLNPLSENGVDVRDVHFAQLLLVWLASVPLPSLTVREQVQAVQNYKYAAHFDLKTVKLVLPDGEVCSAADAGLRILEEMEAFYRNYSEEVRSVLAFQKAKFVDMERRYAWQIFHTFETAFAENGLLLARQRQKEALQYV